MSSRKIIVVQGGQYGSESKGSVAAKIVERRGVDIAVRTGAINAGHTVYYRGVPYKMQQLPTAWVRPETQLVIGAGAYIHPTTLALEIGNIARALGTDRDSVTRRVWIDFRCAVHTEANERRSVTNNRHHLIGATGKGCSQAIVDKINERGRTSVLFRDTPYAGQYRMIDTVEYLHRAYDVGELILIEGTQGHELDMHQGPWPYTTSRMTTSANWVAEAGLSPNMGYEIVLVCRTFPIRVAGNSGPLPGEISWPQLGRYILDQMDKSPLVPFFYEEDLQAFEQATRKASKNYTLPEGSDGLDQHEWSVEDRAKHKVTLSELNATALHLLSEMENEAYLRLAKFFELTTVTRKLRRIANFNPELLAGVAKRERASSIALTFLNYRYPQVWGKSSQIGDDANRWLTDVERIIKVPISMVGTGPFPENFVDALYW